jgi:hypothetical protein
VFKRRNIVELPYNSNSKGYIIKHTELMHTFGLDNPVNINQIQNLYLVGEINLDIILTVINNICWYLRERRIQHRKIPNDRLWSKNDNFDNYSKLPKAKTRKYINKDIKDMLDCLAECN